jgi:2-aminoethylphosphonate-pyruvate transaminase
MHDTLFARGITVYPGKLSGARTFRIANLGALQPADLSFFLSCLKDYLELHGIHPAQD